LEKGVLALDSSKANRMATAQFAISILFFSVAPFSVRATFCAYLALSVLFLWRAPQMFARANGGVKATAFGLVVVCYAFVISAFHDFYWNFFLKFIFIQIYVLIIFWMFDARVLNIRSMLRACEILIYVHAGFFLFQLLYFLLTRHFIDFDSYIRESASESLYETKALGGSLIPIRAVGLFSEPSFYSMTVIPAGAIVLLIRRCLSLACGLAIFTAVMSMSIAAILICAILAAIHVFVGKTSATVKIVILAIAVVISVPLYKVYDLRVNQSVDYDAVASRSLIFEEIKDRNLDQTVFGNGFFWDERNTVGKTHLRGFEVRDSSFYVYLLFTSGIVGVFMFIAGTILMFSGKAKRGYLLYLAPILLFKYHLIYGFLWLVLVLFVVLANRLPFHFQGIKGGRA
jgi:hypothetical protein